ncbi:hypothetical protein [Lichenihabitans psoromatis]|uniref:hypothetical protein n=1 Tax=Lichenihabitans psoromatis TaxID=2528642 RepID=UPI001035B0D6|nr:hypothetical protein [Lichenihabitans psoromatis]
MPSCFVTIATPEYYARACVLRDSIREAMGTEVRFVVLAVSDAGGGGWLTDKVTWLTPDDLGLPFFWDMAFRYELFALANALKPFLIAHVLRTTQTQDLVFLDADTTVLGPFLEVDVALAQQGTSILLTPHADRPQERSLPPTEIDLLRHGIINGGFIALNAGAAATAMVNWWCERMRTECRYDPEHGLYGDQRWLDLVPSLFDEVRIFRHRGYNAAYWNDPDRRPERRGEAWFVGDVPLRFYHFSRWNIEGGESLVAYKDLFYRSINLDRDRLLEDYRQSVIETKAVLPEPPVTRPFSLFSDGSSIPGIVRSAYSSAFGSREASHAELFTHGLEMVLQPCEDLPSFSRIALPHLYATIWRLRKDLHTNRFDLMNRDGQLWFMEWVREYMQGDYGVPDRALGPAHHALAAAADEPASDTA